MADETTSAPQVSDTPETTALLLATFADSYRQEIAAEEDIHRTLPFFGTALGIVVGALAYAAGRLPKWPDITRHEGLTAFWVANGFLALAILDATGAMIYLARAIERRNYQRIGPEPALYARAADLLASYDTAAASGHQRDRRLVSAVQQILLKSYTEVTPHNRDLNRLRYRFRGLASLHLLRSLLWVLGMTTIILMADKLSYFPKVAP